MKLYRTIGGRLVLTYLLLVSVSLALGGAFLLRWMEGSLERRAENQLASQSRVLAHFMSMYTQHPGDLPESTRWVMKEFPSLTRARVRIADAQGHVLGDSRGNPHGQIEPEALQALSGRQWIWFTQQGRSRVAHASSAVELEYPTLTRVGVVDVSSSLSELDDTLQELRGQLIGALALALGGSVLLALVLAQTLVRPIHRIRLAAGRIAEGRLEERVQPSGTVELSQLGGTINHMAEQLARQLGELVSERNKVRTLLASVPDCVVAVNAEGRVTYLNSAAEAAFKIARRQAEGQELNELGGGLLVPLVAGDGEGGEPRAQDLTLDHRVYRALVVPYRDEHDKMGLLLLLRDMTDIRRLEEMRTLFLSSVSHELRTPLTIIKGFAATLLDSTEDDSLKKPLARIDTEADRLTRLVGDLLELTRLRSLKLSMDVEPLVPEEVVEEVVELLTPQAERREVALRFVPGSTATLPADRDRLKQVAINLVDNALKFTPSGGSVTVSTALQGEEWVLSVKDTGPGIPAQDVPHLFDHFFRSRDTQLRSVKGTGLGLAIVKEIVEMHGGRVGAESVVGEGTTLLVRLPAPVEARGPG